MNRARRSVKFERRPSQRFSRRPKYETEQSEKEKISLNMETNSTVYVKSSIDAFYSVPVIFYIVFHIAQGSVQIS